MKALTVDEIREKLRKSMGDEIADLPDHKIIEYYKFWYPAGKICRCTVSCGGDCKCG